MQGISSDPDTYNVVVILKSCRARNGCARMLKRRPGVKKQLQGAKLAQDLLTQRARGSCVARRDMQHIAVATARTHRTYSPADITLERLTETAAGFRASALSHSVSWPHRRAAQGLMI